MPEETAGRSHVTHNAGVYFFVYSVPETILANRGVDADLGPGAEIYHHSIVHSDGMGKVETITAGPAEAVPWLRQLGFTPLKPQIAFLAHPDKSQITGNFDTAAWNHPKITQAFIRTNWEETDFEFAKAYIRSSAKRISSVGYNLAGHNSNSLVRLIWGLLQIHRTEQGLPEVDHPNVLLKKYFRPGSRHDIFNTSADYYITLLTNCWSIARTAAYGTLKLGLRAVRRLLSGKG